MKLKVLAFTCIKRHFEGEIFAPVDVDGEFELQSDLSVLCGSNGNAFRFKNAENASVWIDSNLIRASKQTVTQQSHIDALIIKNSISPQDYLQTEIDILNARNAGEWVIYFSDELTGEFGIIAKGDKGDNGAAGIQGLQGVKGDKGDAGSQGIQGVKGDAGAAGSTWQYPIGYLLIDTANINPFTFLGYGTWQAYGDGRVLVGQDAAQTEFDTLGETGGEKTHTLTAAEMPAHRHEGGIESYIAGGGTSSSSPPNGNISVTGVIKNATYAWNALVGKHRVASEGGGAAHNNLQPYIVVKFWKRVE